MAHPCCCDDDILELPAQASDPTPIPGSGILYTKGANPDLYYENGVGDIVQITDGDHINGAAVGGFTPDRIVYSDASGNLKVETASSTFGYDETTDTMTVRNILGGGGGLPLSINTPALHSISIKLEGTAYWSVLATGSGYTAGTLAPVIDTTNQFGAADLRLKQIFTGPGSAANPAVAIAFASTQTGTGFYATAANTLGVTAGGTLRATWSTTGYQADADNSYNLGGPLNRWGVSFFGAGVAGAPSVVIAFAAATSDQGFYSAATGEIDVATGGVKRAGWTSTAYTVTVPVYGVDGTYAAPAHSFASDTDVGLIRPSAANASLGVVVSGVERLRVDASNQVGMPSGGTVNWSSAAAFAISTNPTWDTSLARASAGVITVTSTLRGGNGSSTDATYGFTNLSNTGMYGATGPILCWTINGGVWMAHDAASFKHRDSAKIGWVSTSNAQTGAVDTAIVRASANNVGFTNGGATTYWVIGAGGIQAGTDNTIDIGATGATRPRTIYLGTSANIEADRGLIMTNQTDAAGGSTGTLGNAPASGDPVYWWKIKINGNNRAIPCWNG